jgi:hypothetical protein
VNADRMQLAHVCKHRVRRCRALYVKLGHLLCFAPSYMRVTVCTMRSHVTSSGTFTPSTPYGLCLGGYQGPAGGSVPCIRSLLLRNPYQTVPQCGGHAVSARERCFALLARWCRLRGVPEGYPLTVTCTSTTRPDAILILSIPSVCRYVRFAPQVLNGRLAVAQDSMARRTPHKQGLT